MSVNIVMLLGTFGVSRLYLEVYNCGRLSKTFFLITFTYYACCLILFSDQVTRYNGWDTTRKTKKFLQWFDWKISREELSLGAYI